ncbi:MAG: hypothetical protein R3B82_06955 [Sandaracinaceae bacterium]
MHPRPTAIGLMTMLLTACAATPGTTPDGSDAGPTPMPDGAVIPDAGTPPGSDAGEGLDAGAVPGAPIAELTLLEPDGAPSPEGVVTFGLPLPPGHTFEQLVAEVDGVEVPTQTVVKRHHADGSVRHAIVSVRAPAMAASSSAPLVLRPTPAPGGPGPALGDLLAGFDSVVTVVEGGRTFRASAADAFAAEATRWLDGEQLVELRTRASLVDGAGAAHSSLEVGFDLRVDALGHARVSVSVDNALHDRPGDHTYDVTIEGSSGDVVLSRTGLAHYHHARWRFVYDEGEPSHAFVRHDLAQLIATGAVPPYDTSITPPASVREADVGRFETAAHGPMEVGRMFAYMPTTGGREDIGPLPHWTAIALVSGDPALARIMYANADMAGSWPVHYRDRETGAPIAIDEWPTLSLHPGSSPNSAAEDRLPDCTSCNSPYTPDQAHQPSLVFVPYLLSGDPWYLDELSFWVSYNFAALNFDYRERERGILSPQTTRAEAWSLRTLGHAAWIAPDDHPSRAYFEERLQNNLAWYAENAVGSNPLGWWHSFSNLPSGGRPDPLMAPDVVAYTSPWMNDFLLITSASLVRMGYPEAIPLRDWLADFTIGRFTNAPDFLPLDGAPYHLAVENAAGERYDTWASMYAASFAGRTEPAPTSFPADCGFCYPAIARAALAMVVETGRADAAAAYRFVHTNTASTSTWAESPTWALVL